MGIKRYILLSAIYMVVLGLYVYSFTGELFNVELFGLSLQLPIAAWIVIPVFLLFIASVVHFEFYYLKYFFHERALKKDTEAFKEWMKKRVLGEKGQNIVFKTEAFKSLGQMSRALSFDPCLDLSFTEEDLNAIYKLACSVQSGTYEDLKKYKLSKENPLVIQNGINRLNVEPKYAFEVLKSCKETDKENPLCVKAYDVLLETASFNEIKRYDFTPDKRTFRRMMERYLDADDSFEMDIKSIEEMLEQFNADRADYLELAREIKIKLSPDALIALFEKLYNAKGNVASDAYLYVLYDLQMIDKIRDILDNSDNDEFVKFKTLLFLRDHGKSIDIDTFLRA